MTISTAESRIMEALWRKSPLTAEEIVADVAEPQGWSEATVKSLIKLSLVRTLGTDPRISDVQDVQFEDDPAYRARHPEVTDQDIRDQRHQRMWTVDVLLQAADGQNQILSANVGV